MFFSDENRGLLRVPGTNIFTCKGRLYSQHRRQVLVSLCGGPGAVGKLTLRYWGEPRSDLEPGMMYFPSK